MKRSYFPLSLSFSLFRFSISIIWFLLESGQRRGISLPSLAHQPGNPIRHKTEKTKKKTSPKKKEEKKHLPEKKEKTPTLKKTKTRKQKSPAQKNSEKIKRKNSSPDGAGSGQTESKIKPF